MQKFLWTAALAVCVCVVSDARGLMIAPNPPGQRAASAEVIVVGKVTAVAKEMVEASSPFAGAKDKQKYVVATIKVQTGLIGAEKVTEVKVGYVPPPKLDPNAKLPPGGIRPPFRRGPVIELKEGQELMLFLAKHPKADFYVIPGMNMPVDIKSEQGKKDLDAVKKVAAVLADPMKSLKSDKPEIRGEAATVMVMRYRAYPQLGGEVQPVAIPAEENKLILKGLADATWNSNFRFDGPPSAFQAFSQLGLTEKDGWVPPAIVNTPGAPQIDFAAVQKDAFTKWLEGPGKNYVIKKNVPKVAAQK